VIRRAKLQMKVIIISVLLFVAPLGCELSSQRETAFSTEEKGNSTFKVRVSAFRESRTFGGALAGARYVFEAKNINERDWKEFMTYQHDDPVPVDRNKIVLVDERFGYVFMMRKFAGTTDGGITWSSWDISKIDGLKNDLSCRIQQATIMGDGTGTMDIKCNRSTVVLSTRDFGVTWNQ
jgi:hypothetical protein